MRLFPTREKMKQRFNIQRRMLLFALAVGLLTFLSVGGIFLYTMLDVRNSLRTDATTLRDEVVSSVGSFAEEQAMRSLQGVTVTTARHLGYSLHKVKDDSYLIGEEMSNLLRRDDADVCFVLDSEGKMVFAQWEDGILLAGPEAEIFQTEEPRLLNALRRMAAGEEGVVLVTVQGEEYYLAYAPMGTMGWSFGALIEKAQVMDDAAQMQEGIWRELGDFRESEQRIFSEASTKTALLLVPLICLLFYGSGRSARRITDPIRKLAKGVREISRGDLDWKITIQTGDEIEDLAVCFNSMTEDLKKHMENLAKAVAEKEHVQTELSVAGKIQRDMLPQVSLSSRDEGKIDLHAVMYPARNVGGDFYDFYPLDEDHLVVTIADISGKGIPAALFMVMVRTILRDTISVMSPGGEDSPMPNRLCLVSPPVQGMLAEAMGRANDLICKNNANSMFATVFLGILDLRSGCLDYVNAGHNPPLLRRTSYLAYLPTADDTFAGMMEGLSFHQRRLLLAPGDLLLLYTDGVTEAMNKEDELFTENRLKETVSGLSPEDSPEEILHTIRETVQLHADGAEQSDDLTMLALRYRGCIVSEG